MFAIALLFALSSPSLPAQAPTDSPEAAGSYVIYSNGIKKGFSRYAHDAQGRLLLEGDSGLGSASRGVVTSAGDAPTQIDFEITGKTPLKISYAIANGELRRTAPEGETKSPMPNGGRFYYPTQPILLSALLDQFPSGAKGFQKLPALDLLTGKPREITAELYRTESRRIHGKQQSIRLWRLIAAPTPDAVIYTDTSNRPLYWWVPAVQFEMVLEGYEELRPASQYEKSVSPPVYKVKTENDVAMPMRDGVHLMADVYRPDAEGKFPVLLQRTCYDRSEFGNSDGEFYAQRGYVYVTQHVRGRGNSEGEFNPFLQEAADGSDSVEWCAAQPWSSGKVGMLGASYNGFCEWMAAKMRPKGLTTLISTVPMPGSPDGAPWVGGSFFFANMLEWYGLLRDKAHTQPFTDDPTAAQNTLPLSEADTVLFGKHIPSYQFDLARDRYDEGVKQGAYRDEIDKIDLPVLHISGWLDSVGVGTRLNYTQMVANGKKHQKLVYGPWTHFTNRESMTGEWDFGPEAYIDLKMLSLRWFDRWLKDLPNGIDKEPAVSTYLLNEHRWEQSSSWPSRSLTPQRWYLHAPATAGGSGGLSLQKPKNDNPEHYRYDPAKYVFSLDNQVNFFFAMLSGLDVSPLCTTTNKDRLVYESEPLAKPMRLCGPVRGALCAATSAVDTDWVLALVDVSPEGKALTIGCGMVRARFRASLEHPTLLEPNMPTTYDIDMWQTGVSLPAGHRLRVVVLSTLFPERDRNLNTGESIATGTRILAADQTIFHDPAHLSYITLPILPTRFGST